MSNTEESKRMPSSQSIAQRLPDLPRWVEARDLLLSGACAILGFQEEPELSLVIRDPATSDLFIVGRPAERVVHAAVQQHFGSGFLLAPPEQVSWLTHVLPDWTHRRAVLHRLRGTMHLPPAAVDAVRFLDPVTLPQLPIPVDLLGELASGAEHSVIAARFVAQQPVAFCYAGAITESLWDVSIDTLEAHRRHGYAVQCAVHMIRHMEAYGKHPVWAALDENPASWRLAQKLGFVPVDEVILFEPTEQATAFQATAGEPT